jgi:hypothetical protein
LKKPDKLSFGVGVAVALLLTLSAYYSSSHSGTARTSELAYLVFFPPSIGLMATETRVVLSRSSLCFFLQWQTAPYTGSLPLFVGDWLVREIDQAVDLV